MGLTARLAVLALSIGLGTSFPNLSPRDISTITTTYTTTATSTVTVTPTSVITSTITITSASTTTPIAAAAVAAAACNGIWQPTTGTTWNIELINPITNPSRNGYDVWDIDLFGSSASTISSLQQQGAKVICYFSAGASQAWVPDNGDFSPNDLGNDLSGWPGERWLNIRSDGVRQVMLNRMDLAVQKNCDGVDPDNIDGYNNDNGLGLSEDDSTDYVLFLAAAAQERNLAIGLKNAGKIIPNVINVMHWSVNEECIVYDECDIYAPFVAQGKPVFSVEYPKGDSTSDNSSVSDSLKAEFCNPSSQAGFSTILKNIDLDGWTEVC